MKLQQGYNKMPGGWAKHETAIVEEGVQIGEGTTIGPFCHVMNGAIIGRNCTLFGHNVVEKATLGFKVVMNYGAVVAEGANLGDDVILGQYARIEASTLADGVRVWHYSHVQGKTSVGRGTKLGNWCQVAENVHLGEYVRVQNGNSLYEGLTIEDEVFIGPHCVFTNDPFPPSPKSAWLPTFLRKGCALGAGTVVVCGNEIGAGAGTGAGAVVTKDIPDGELWTGLPAKKHGDRKTS